MLVQRRRRWASIKTTSVRNLVFAGKQIQITVHHIINLLYLISPSRKCHKWMTINLFRRGEKSDGCQSDRIRMNRGLKDEYFNRLRSPCQRRGIKRWQVRTLMTSLRGSPSQALLIIVVTEAAVSEKRLMLRPFLRQFIAAYNLPIRRCWWRPGARAFRHRDTRTSGRAGAGAEGRAGVNGRWLILTFHRIFPGFASLINNSRPG